MSNKTMRKLTDEQIEAFGTEMESIRKRVLADLGERDAKYIRTIVRRHRQLDMAGRALLMLGFLPPAWLAGTAAQSAAKILDNMEIGHNIMHGQYDWMGEPAYSSKHFDWDTACPADQWRHSHNYMHHTFTNVQGVDRDIGYGVMRLSDEEKWHPYCLLNPLWAALLQTFFQYGVALHDLEVENIIKGKRDHAQTGRLLKGIGHKTGKQTLKDYVLFPLLGGPVAPFIFAGNLMANLVRNLWTSTIIFCGHFPDEVEQFSTESIEGETRGQWYYRQLLGSANIEGGQLFHVMSGNLSFQIEHHLFPDVPAHRYAEISHEVRDSCARYGLPYHTGSLTKQYGNVIRRIFRLALPSKRKKPHTGNETRVRAPAAKQAGEILPLPV